MGARSNRWERWARFCRNMEQLLKDVGLRRVDAQGEFEAKVHQGKSNEPEITLKSKGIAGNAATGAGVRVFDEDGLLEGFKKEMNALLFGGALKYGVVIVRFAAGRITLGLFTARVEPGEDDDLGRLLANEDWTCTI
jgi:hypothetical protein